jgi:hypothetical protein
MMGLIRNILEWATLASTIFGALILVATGILWKNRKRLSTLSQVTLLKNQGRHKEAMICAIRGLWSCSYPCSEKDLSNVQKVIDNNRLLLSALQGIIQPSPTFDECIREVATLLDEQQRLLEQWQLTMSKSSHRVVRKQWYDKAIALAIIRQKMLESLYAVKLRS